MITTDQFKNISTKMQNHLPPELFKQWIQGNQIVAKSKSPVLDGSRLQAGINYSILNEIKNHGLKKDEWDLALNKTSLLEDEIQLLQSQEDIYRLQQAKRYVRTQKSAQLKNKIYKLNIEIGKKIAKIKSDFEVLKQLKKHEDKKREEEEENATQIYK